MALINPVIELPTFEGYLHKIGVIATAELELCFTCGLPAVWLYMKAIGLENVFFDILKKAENRELLFKELFYLLIFTNNNNKFFPHVLEDFLKIEIPPEIAEAQVEITSPVFEMAYIFTREELIKTLEQVVKQNVMVRLGTKSKCVAIMYDSNGYHVYHADNLNTLGYNSIEGCVDSIMRVINTKPNGGDHKKPKSVALFITAASLVGVPIEPMPDSKKLLQEFLHRDIPKKGPNQSSKI